MANLFAYGTLMSPDVMRAVCGTVPDGEPAVLEGFVRRRVRGTRYPAIVPGDEPVDGWIYRDLSDKALARIDAYEGDQYDRRRVTVTLTSTGRTIEALAYVLRDEWKHVLGDEPWDGKACK